MNAMVGTSGQVSPGKHPFRMKGLGYRGVFRRLSEAHGRQAVLDSCEDDETRRFLAQPFLAASWYDVFPMVALCQIGARLDGCTFTDFCLRHSAIQASDDVSGVYRALLSLLSPELAMRGVIKITKRYFDFGGAEILEIGSGHCLARRTGVPRYVGDWYSIIAVAYIEAVMEAAGAQELQVSSRLGPTSRVGGYEVANHDFSVRWR